MAGRRSSVQIRLPLPIKCRGLTRCCIEKPLLRGFLLGANKVPGEALAAKEQQIRELLEPAVEALGFVVWGLEYLSQGRHTLLRLYIDDENGVGVDDCAAVSRQVSSILDVEDPISGDYTLEVSSPGLDRLLFQLEQYPDYAGEWIEIRLRVPFEGRRKFNIKGSAALNRLYCLAVLHRAAPTPPAAPHTPARPRSTRSSQFPPRAAARSHRPIASTPGLG